MNKNLLGLLIGLGLFSLVAGGGWWVITQEQGFARRLAVVEKRLDSLIVRERPGGGVAVVLTDSEVALIASKAAVLVEETKAQASAAQTPPESAPEPAVQASYPREVFVPLGSGSTSSTEFVTISSAQATVNSDLYGTIEGVYLEASLHVVNGYVRVRLKDTTNGAVYFDQEIKHNSSTPAWKASSALSLGSGSHTYVVQMKSDVGEVGSMDGARLRIVLK